MPQRRSFQQFTKYVAAQTNAELVAAPSGGARLVVTDVRFENGIGALGYISLLDGSGGTVLMARFASTNSESKFPASVLDGKRWARIGRKPETPRELLRLTPETALCVTSTGVSDHAVQVHGYIE